MDGFKVPHTIPQDLLLIQELIGVPSPPASLQKEKTPVDDVVEQDDDISSSDDEDQQEVASQKDEEEIAADLVLGTLTDEDDLNSKVIVGEKVLSEPSESDSDSSDDEGPAHAPKIEDLDADDDEDPVPAATSGTYFQTKHELPEAAVDISIPDVDEVGPDEVLEKVGEVMTIVDRVAIVRGLPSHTLNRGSDRALDSETLLVFGDRKVMGYIYETFGPTTQPLYQVKFSAAYPLDPTRVFLDREVFHVPLRSKFVFVSQIKAFKGSDASNVHDEEPADDELEFSDDEAEAQWRGRLKRKRGESRARSQSIATSSSRQATPNPTFMRDHELIEETFFSRNAYDEHGPYDIDYSDSPSASAGPSSSRPAPMPYDDPYGEEYNAPAPAPEVEVDRELRAAPPPASRDGMRDRDRGRDRGYERSERSERSEGYGRGRDRDQGRDRGRGRGHGRERGGHRDRDGHRERGRGGRGGGGGGRGSQSQRYGGERQSESQQPRDVRERSISPTSLAIARATGQMGGNQHYQPHQQQHQQQNSAYPPASGYAEASAAAWGYGQMPTQMQFQFQHQQHHHQQQQQYGYGMAYQQHQQGPGFMSGGAGAGAPASFVQPHINPRFASAFGMGVGVGVGPQQTYGGGGVAFQQYPQAPPLPNSGTPTPSGSVDEWAVPLQERSLSTTSAPASRSVGDSIVDAKNETG